jgi:hypothetical protein
MNKAKTILNSFIFAAAVAIFAAAGPPAAGQDMPLIDESPATPTVEMPAMTAPPIPPATPTQPVPPAGPKTAAPQSAPAPAGLQNLTLKTGTVVKVDAGDSVRIYIDKGSLDGVTGGMEMDVFKSEPVTDMNGTVLDEDEVAIGRIRAVEVKSRVTICEAVSKGDYERGNYAKYYTREEAKSQKEAHTVPGRCPADMLFDSGGAFVFLPGAMFASGPAKEEVAETQPFCIDSRLAEDVLSWEDAGEDCGRRHKRLCAKQELQKVCGVWEKPKPCPRDLWVKKACPEQNTLIDFYRSQEWTSDPVTDESGAVKFEANSCSCPGTSPVCTHCVYAGCRGAKKPYRCCSDSSLEPEKNEKEKK